MPREGDKWRVVRGDCLWNIAKAVYGNGVRWPEIADANGIPRSRANLIYPGQLFILPGITGGSPSPAPAPAPQPPPAYTQTPNIVWFSLAAGERRKFQVIWEQSHNKFEVRWEIWDSNGHLWMADGGDHNITTEDRQKADEFTYPEYQDRFVIRCSIRAVDDNGNGLSGWAIKEYDLRNAPPGLPSDPTFSIDSQNNLTVTLENIDPDINADQIEIAIYQDDTNKFSTAKVNINKETNFAKYVVTVPAGHSYKVRCRAVRGNEVSGWTNFTGSEFSTPVAPTEITTLRPQTISEQGSKQYGVFIEWNEVPSAKTYEVQWTTNIEYFDLSNNVSSQTTEEGKGPRLLITDIEIGHEYFFRVRSINDKGSSLDWTPIRSIKLGSAPSAPTTWSNTSSAVIGEDLNLYWTHNSTDGSLESYARLHITVIDSANPDKEPMEFTEVIENTKPEEEKNSNSVYKINTNDPEWAWLQNGFIIKWKVQTAGIIGDYSPWSIEREINVYTPPQVTLDITNKDGVSIEEINRFPFHFSIGAAPETQKPISYYIEVVADQGYNTIDKVGNVQTINPGDKVYQKYYDPERNSWRFLVEMSPSNIDLEDGISYTVNVTVSMDSGLSATASQTFLCNFDDQSYQVYANVTIDKETLTASIHPYCTEYYEEDGEGKTKLTDNCKLAVYRRQYDGTFVEIASEIPNEENTYVVDPHPSLDYARYRIVARTNDTGAISYADISGVEVKEPAVVIQWAEAWTKFDYTNDPEEKIEKPWAGSMLKLPYNVDVSESKSLDVSLIEYVGREHPVSYYGTQVGETANWNVTIPAKDKEVIYALRRLSKYKGDVYVREPSGTGYWANIGVTFNINHMEVTIPVSFTVKRVEGGM